MIDILFLAHNRRAFTEASLKVLLANTDWSDARLIVYDDNSKDGTRELLADMVPTAVHRFGTFDGPVDVMNHYLRENPGDHQFAKIDSDTMVPPGWLVECQTVFRRCPQLDFLGIEQFTPISAAPDPHRGYQKARHVGGIGLFRTRAFKVLPRPMGRFGFTEFQLELPGLEIGWIAPAIPVFLLDKLPREPWRSLSSEYVARGWQRSHGEYPEVNRDMWSWWCE